MEGIGISLHTNQRGATSNPVPASASASERSSARSSKRMKMTTAKSDVMPRTSTAPRVEVPHACKERLDVVKRALNFKTLGSTVDFFFPTIEGAKAIVEVTTELGYHNGRETIDFLLPTIMGAKIIAKISESLRHKNGGETIDWLIDTVRTQQSDARTELDWWLPIQTRRLQELTSELGFHRGGETIDWLLHQAKPAIASRMAGHSASTATAGYSGIYSSPAAPPFSTQFSQNPQAVRPSTFPPSNGLGGGISPIPTPVQCNTYSSPAAPPFLTPQFSQNPQMVRPNTFTPTNQLAGGTTPTPTPTLTTQYSSNPRTPIPTGSRPTTTTTPTPVQSSRPTTTPTPIPNTYFPGAQSQMNGYGQFQNNGMFNSGRMMQPTSRPQSQISTGDCQGKSQQETLQNILVPNTVGSKVIRTRQAEKHRAACTANIAALEVGVRESTLTNNHPKHNAASVNYGNRRSKMDQRQAPPQLNHLTSQATEAPEKLTVAPDAVDMTFDA